MSTFLAQFAHNNRGVTTRFLPAVANAVHATPRNLATAYVVRAVGTCDPATGTAFIETAEACTAAATALGQPDTEPTVLAAGDTASATMPHGCYHKASNHVDTQLWFNEAGMNDSTDTERVSICGEFRAVAPSLDAPATLRLDLQTCASPAVLLECQLSLPNSLTTTVV